MRNLVIILDPAHGSDVPGKSSPDGKHKEYIWSRMICNKLKTQLSSLDFRVEITNKTDKEIGLSNRKNFASNLKLDNPHQVKFLVSLHNNGAGDGTKWANARGFEIYTTPGQTRSDLFADIIFNNLKKDFPTYKARVDLSDGDSDKESKFTVLMGSGYSAVLLEWLFQDNREDVALLTSNMVNDNLVNSLVGSFMYIDDNLDKLK